MSDGTVSWKKTISDKGRMYSLNLMQEQGEMEALYVTDGPTYTMQRLYDGKILWRKVMTGFDQVEGQWVFDGILYFFTYADHVTPFSSVVYAVRIADGDLLWKYKTERMLTRLSVMNGMVCVSSLPSLVDQYQNKPLDVQVEGLQVSDGKVLWKRVFAQQGMEQTASLVTTNEALILTTFTKDSSSADIGIMSAIHVRDGTLLWSKQWKDTSVSYVALENGILYAGTRTYTESDQTIEGTAGGTICAYKVSDGSALWCQKTNTGVSWFTFN